MDSSINNEQHLSPKPWFTFSRWFVENTFTPPWLARRWQHPMVGFVAAFLLQALAVLATLLLLRYFPSFAFTSLLEIFVIAIVALNWGAGPSITATIIGLLLINYFILPPHFTLQFRTLQQNSEGVIFLLVGLAISVSASRLERERRVATAERALLNAIIEAVPDVITIHDEQGRLIRLNQIGRQRAKQKQVTETLQSISGNRELYTSSGQLFTPSSLPIAQVLRGEEFSNQEMNFYDIDEQEHVLSVSAVALRDTHNKIRGAITISHDVTDLRMSERAAAQRVSQLEAIFEAFTDGLFILDKDEQHIEMNRSAREMLGYADDTGALVTVNQLRLAGLEIRDENNMPLARELWPQSRILHGEVLKGPNIADVLLTTFDGRTIQVNVSGAPARDKQGRIVGAVWACRDVTERRLLEQRTHKALEALLTVAQTLVLESDHAQHNTSSENEVPRQLVELTRNVLHCERVSICTVEPDGDTIRARATAGLTADQEARWLERTAGISLSTVLIDPEFLPRLQADEVIQIVREQAGLLQNAFEYYNIQSMIHVPIGVGNQFIGVLSVDNNTSGHTYTTEEIGLARTIARLAGLVIERDRLLREREEARVNEIALREANYRMNEFLGIASHELKTPLTTIKGSIQLLDRRIKRLRNNHFISPTDQNTVLEEAQGLIQRSETQTNRLTRLVNDLLDVSRVQANKLEPRMEPCDLITIVKEVAQEQRQIAHSRTISLLLPPIEHLPMLADADRIGQVLTNYLSNALKYSAENKPVAVTVQLEQFTGGKAHIARVCVRDEGPGLPDEEQARLWNRFYRVPGIEVQSGSGVGLGLGLYICKTIIELHHGQVGIESIVDQGSTFWFTLPLSD